MRVLFVDDEEKVLEGLRRMLRPMRHEWTCEFATSATEALQKLSATPFDVVVSDMRMPGMDGAELLARVRDLHPAAVRIVLSGHSDMESILRSVGPSHQYLTKPCDAETLKHTIASACALKSLFEEARLRDLVGQLDALPSMPTLYRELVSALQTPDASLREIGRIIATDVGMTAQVLRLVNSSYFGLCGKITSAERAVAFLGLATVTSLVLTVGVFRDLDAPVIERLGLAGLWPHSIAVAMGAKRLAQAETKNSAVAEDAFAAGMLHDAGILVLAANVPERYAAVVERAHETHETLHEAEQRELGCDHAAIGAYLLSVWGLPNSVIEAVAYHHRPSRCPNRGFSALTAVHAVDAFDEERRASCGENALAPALLDIDYLDSQGARTRVDLWRQECRDREPCDQEV